MKIKEFFADKLKVEVYENRLAMGQAAAKVFEERVNTLLAKKDEISIIFAAAPSQNEFLEGIVKSDKIPWQCINAFHMDEYIGLSPDAPQGFGKFLKDRIFGKVTFKSVNYIDTTAEPQAECERYSALLQSACIDMVCMGIGENGHIAFNDPHIALFDDEKTVKIVDLDEKCRAQQVNDGCFDSLDKVPTHAITLTIPTLVNTSYILCVVPATTKAQAVYRTINGSVDQACPATILRTHDNAILFTETDSASLIM